MRSIFPSAAVSARRYPLLSGLRSAGFGIGSFETGQPAPGDLFLVEGGEATPMPARTVVIADGNAEVIPAQNGNPARIAFPAEDAAIGNAFARALLAGPTVPTAADPESLALFALAERVAGADITVLIGGPTGTGKEVLARAIHAGSPRRDGPFVAINCAALPETMLEAMLFGHVKGAFTGASAAGEGFFRAADGGTLLLDEIAEMPLALQAKLLRVLQEREVVPIGACQPQRVDVRVVACANRDLQAEVAAGRSKTIWLASIVSPPQNSIARWITFSSSRTLPGQSCATSVAIASSDGQGTTWRLPAWRRIIVAASAAMSPVRSASGLVWSGNTDRR